MSTVVTKKQQYILENLGCANCAAKIESKIAEMPEVESATFAFMTKQLRLVTTTEEDLTEKIQAICDSIEDGVKVIATKKAPVKATITKQMFILEGLNCANCAAKIEDKIKEMPEVESATFAFMTKQLRLVTNTEENLQNKLQALCDSIEDGVSVVPAKGATAKAVHAHSHNHGEGCCGHDEEHGHSHGHSHEGDCCGHEHGHDHGHAHSQDDAYGHDHDHHGAEGWFDKAAIIFSAMVLLVVSFTDFMPDSLETGLLLVAYVALGYGIIWTALKNLTKGQFFDENFLMTIATGGAVIIGEYPEAVGVLLFYRIGEYFEHRATEQNRSQIMEALDLRPEVVNLVTAEGTKVIPAEEVAVGDVVLVRVGDRVPLDGTIIEGASRLDTSAITGEPVPMTVNVGDSIFSGCVNTAAVIKVRVDKVLEESMVSRILESVESAAANKPVIDRFITRFARVYTPIVVLIAILTALIPGYITGEWKHWIYTALTFLVISCPCALVLSVPLAFFSGIGAGAKLGILFKGGISLEAIKNAKMLAFDKTGTITEGNFIVHAIETAEGFSEDEVLRACGAAEVSSTHPIAVSIVNAAKEKDLLHEVGTQVEEFAGEGLKALVEDKTVFAGNERLFARFGIALPVLNETEAGTKVLVAIDGKYAGRIVISDTIKEDAVEAMEELHKLGVKTALFTGDAQESAEYVARVTGIDRVKAKLLPEDKLTAVKELRKEYGEVMFIGDGINDAPVLAGADVGGAMGSGADAAIEAADVVFMTPKMSAVPKAISLARTTLSIAWQNVIVALGIKVVVMLLGLIGYASMWFAVFADTGVTILCILNSIRILYKKF